MSEQPPSAGSGPNGASRSAAASTAAPASPEAPVAPAGPVAPTPATPQAETAAETDKPAPVDLFAQVWHRLREHKVIQWGLAYLGAALALAHGQEILAHTFHWPAVVGRAFVGALIFGFPVALVLAWYHGHKGLKSFNPAEMTIVAMLLLIGAGGLILLVHPPAEHPLPARREQAPADAPASPKETSAAAPRTATISEIAALVQKDRYGEAFLLARPLIAVGQGGDPELAVLWRQIVLPMKPLVTEPGATVFFKPYDDAKGEWNQAGVTPFTKAVDAPRGVLRLKVEKPGFVTGYFVIHNPGPSVENDPPDPPIAGISFAKVLLPLAAEGMIPDDMVLVPHTNLPVYVAGLSGLLSRAGGAQYDIQAFAIARREVTNQEFKEFVDAGGYDNPTYWEGLKFEDAGRALTWKEAKKRFVDATGRPGPAGWQLSTYRADQAEMPVGGISWYEAVAYARFRGLALPTLHHWARAAFAPHEAWFNTAPDISLASRFGADSPLPASSAIGLGPWGTFHMAGNVREWVWNFAGRDGVAMGGAWSDYATLYQSVYTASPMQRAPENGMRLMRPLASADVSPELLKPVALAFGDDGANLTPVSDEAFQAMRFQFTSAHARPRETSVQQVQETPLWIAEEVILKFANQETSTLYIVRPKSHRNPLQPVIYGPPADCCFLGKQPNRNALQQMRPPADTIVNSGRALVIPVWFGSYERALPPPRDPAEQSDMQRRAALAWYQDVSTTLDYLETRPDIDSHRAGYLAVSYGAILIGPVILATEGRLKTGILISGGLQPAVHPMANAVNYLPRIRIPMLMVNGRYDHLFRYEQSQKPMFELLGTPANDKTHIVYDVGHFAFPSNSVAMDISDWLDKHLGPVR